MKPFSFVSSVVAISLIIGVPDGVLAHIGHGDEFQAQGGVNRVKVNAETDQMLGIVTTPIASSTDGSPAVMIPVTALVDADGKQLVFVQYNDFYEPVPITTGATQGDLIEVADGLSVGENLVTQGSLSLYAESRKTQTAASSPTAPAASTSPTAIADPQTSPQADNTHAQADAQGIPHGHDAAGNLSRLSNQEAPQEKGFPVWLLAAGGVGTVAIFSTIALLAGNRKRKSVFSDKDGGY